MPIKVSCQCGKSFAAKDSLAGKRVKCPKCGGVIQIPGGPAKSPKSQTARPGGQGASRSSAPSSTTATAGASASSGGASIDDLFADAGVAAPSATGRRCPECRADMAQEAVLCIECGYNTTTGKRIATRTDSDLQAERERRFREMAERGNRKGPPGEKKSSARHSSGPVKDIPWEGDDGLIATAQAVLFNTRETFRYFDHYGGMGAPTGFALFGFWAPYFCWMGIGVALLAATNSQALAQMDWGAFMGGMGVNLVSSFISMPIQLLVQSGIVHLALKAVGGARYPYETTYRVTAYCSGSVAFLAMAIPCFGLLVAIPLGLVVPVIGYAAAHETDIGKVVLAMILALVGTFAVIGGMIVMLVALLAGLSAA